MHTQSLPGQAINPATRTFLPALFSMLLGFMLILLVGFAPIPALHNAAHDTRHTADFPCH